MFNSFLYVYQRVAIPNCGTGTTRYNDNSYPLHHGSLNVPIEHRPTIRYMVYNGYYKVMSNIPKMGQLPTPVHWKLYPEKSDKKTYFLKNPMCFFLMFRDDSLVKKKLCEASASCQSQAWAPVTDSIWWWYGIFMGLWQKIMGYLWISLSISQLTVLVYLGITVDDSPHGSR